MSLQVRYRNWDCLLRRPWMKFLWLSFAFRASVPVHVMASEVVVVDPDRVPGAID